MDCWATYSQRTSHCASNCGKQILAGDVTIVTKVFKTLSEDKRVTIYIYKHFDCWVADAKLYLLKNPFVAAGGHTGRPKTVALGKLTSDEKVVRLKLLRRKASLDQQLRLKRLLPKESRDVDSIAHIQEIIAATMVDIAQVGGIPANWIEDMLIEETC